jgi:amino acid transporter
VRSAEHGTISPGLIRAIGPWALAAFAINGTIGAGIFGLPAKIQALVGNYSIVIMVLCGALIAIVALCFAEVASRFDRTGGPQVYAAATFGPLAGFGVGWMLWVSRLASCSAIVNLLIDYGNLLWAPLREPLVRAFAITTVVVVYTWVNVRGIRQATAVSTTFTIAKLVPLIGFVAVGAFFVEPAAIDLPALPTTTDFSTATLLATFAFFGFDATTVVAGEVREPRRSIPFAIFVAIGSVVVLYTAIQLVCVATLPELATSERPLAEAATAMVGSWGGIAMSLGAVVSCLGVFGAVMTPGTRQMYALAESQQLPPVLARLHPGYRTPHWSILVTGLAILLLALSGSFIYLAKISLITRITVFAITCATLPLMRRRADLPEATFKLPAGSVFGCAGAALYVLFLATSSMRELVDVAIAVLVGFALFGLSRYVRRDARLGNV